MDKQNYSRVVIPMTAQTIEDDQLPDTKPHKPVFNAVQKENSQYIEDKKKNENDQLLPLMLSNTEGNCQIKSVQPLKITFGKFFLGFFLSLITFGIFWIVCKRNNILYKYFFYSICCFKEASSFLVENSDGTFLKQSKYIQKGMHGENIIAFKNRYMDYFYNPFTNKFKAREFLVNDLKTRELLELQGLSSQDVKKRLQYYGQCIIKFEIMNLFQFLWQQLTKVSMLLVYLSIVVWALEGYYFFAINMFWITGLTLIILYIFYRHSNKKILSKTTKVVPILRLNDQNQLEQIQSNDVVPEDIIDIQPEVELPCDIILISGECFVNEANITGETDPIPKRKLENDDRYFSYSEHSSSVIYEGTKILNVRDNAKGLVIRTGFSTKKGQVIRDTLFKTFKINDFIKSLLYFNIALTIFFLVFYLICQFWLSSDEKIPQDIIWLKLGEGIVTFLAASLIPAINISMISAIVRLQNRKIQGVHPESIYESGGIDIVCMDKTGTITEQKVNPKYVYNNITKQQINVEDIQNKKFQKNEEIIQKLFASCIQAQPDQKDPKNILGNEIDVQLFKLSGYIFTQNNDQNVLFEVTQDNLSLQVLKRFDFKSENACMTVIVKDGNKGYVFVKGSPEKLRSNSRFSSLPMGFDNQLQNYLNDGYRVLGLAYKEIDLNTIDTLERNQIETNLDYLGFVVLENRLKHDTYEVFQRLLKAEVPIKVISGDNMFTVANTAVQVNLLTQEQPIYYLDCIDEQVLSIKIRNPQKIDFIEQEFNIQQSYQQLQNFLNPLLKSNTVQFCMTGKVIRMFNDIINMNQQNESQQLEQIKMFKRLILVSKIFGRCSPKLKKSIIQTIQSQKLKVCMLGDGSNDCLSIQQSDVGISFSNADAALASSFCSMTDSINCVEKVMAEGRSTLSIMFETCHLFIQISINRMIFHMIALFYYQTPLDSQLVFVSYYGGYVITMICYYCTSPMDTLSHLRINYLMTSKRSYASILGKWSTSIIVSLILLDQILRQDFYNENIVLEVEGVLNSTGQITTLQFYQYCLLSAFCPYIFYTAYPSKQRMYKNYALFIIVLLTSFLSIVVFFTDESTFAGLQLDDSLTQSFRTTVFIVTFIVGVLQLCWEKFIVNKQFQIAENNIIPVLN